MMSAARARFPAIRLTDELVIGEVKDTPEVVFSTLAAALGSERDALILRNGNADPIVAMPWWFWLRALSTIADLGAS